ncbi:MAG: hypothetical protein V1661_00385 [bacterium]
MMLYGIRSSQRRLKMSAFLIKALNFLVLAAGVAILYFCQKANPDLFSLGTHLFTNIWITMLFVYFGISASNKLLITFNKIYPIIGLLSLCVLFLLLLSIFATLFVHIPKTNLDTSYAGIICLLVMGWTIWDVFVLTIHAHSLYNTNDTNQR